MNLKKIRIIVFALLFVALISAIIYSGTDSNNNGGKKDENPHPVAVKPVKKDYSQVLKTATDMAAMYDYDGAIDFIRENAEDYERDEKLAGFVAECNANRQKLVKWPDNSKITHVFFHSLIENTDVVFSSRSADDYNCVMTTIDEFNRIITQMYERGYVLVRLSDIADFDKTSGKMSYKPIYLPEGKIPFVLSQDDLSYYEYMKKDGGFANRLIVTDDGKIMNEKDNPDGSVTTGTFDVVPILDEFVEKHPDFSYHGAKGIVALTGYNGVLGYRTSYICYGTSADIATVSHSLFETGGYDAALAKKLAKEAHAYDNMELLEDRMKARKVAKAMKENGWEFANHTWGHMGMDSVVDRNTGEVKSERFYRDLVWWDVEVMPIVGKVDTIIFAYGADIFNWHPYTDNNQAFTYLKSKGYNYFCNVDSSRYFVQINENAGGNGYLRQGRRNLDGQLMFRSLLYPDLKLTEDLFDVKSIFDKRRPLPVKGVELPEKYSENF